jgi:dTDP-4-amino-4,6-dideoxygalactose transaminase
MGGRERELLLDAFDSGWLAPLGPHVDGFEREMATRVGVKDAAALSSGTASLHLALHMLGIGPGDRVIAPTLTFIATVTPVIHLGAEVVLVDSCKESWNIDPQGLADELRESAEAGCLPKAVISVDLYGQCADYDAIEELCAKYEVPLIEDAAESLGASYGGRAAGSFGAMSVLSFNGNKIITTSGGGMLLSDREEWVVRARKLASQAKEPVAHYEHLEVGFNYRMSNVLAAMGRGQLETLDEHLQARRRHNGAYRDGLGGLPGVDFMPLDPRGEPNIESRAVWKPMHLQPALKGVRCRGGEVSESLFERGLCLPSGSGMSDADRDSVVAAIQACHRNVNSSQVSMS